MVVRYTTEQHFPKCDVHITSGIAGLLDATQVNLFIVTVRDFNGAGGKYVTITSSSCGVAIRLTLSTDACNIGISTQIRMGKTIFNKE